MGLEQDGLAEPLESAAGSLHAQAQVEEMLRAAVFSARDTVPGAEEASVSVVQRNGRFHTVAATAPVAYRLDELQYRLGEGPCIDALEGQPNSSTSRLSAESRWPRYSPRAVRLGVESQFGVQLPDETGSVAALNLYASRPGAFGPESAQVATLFTTQAGYALGRATDQRLTDALSTRKVLGQAIGILMERHRLNEQGAFAFLVGLSHSSSTKLRVVALQVVTEVEQRGGP